MTDPNNVGDLQPSLKTAEKNTVESYHCELFPTRTSVFVFTFYVSLCSTQYVLVKASQTSSEDYKYNTTSVVFITEALKLLIATVLCIRAHSVRSLIDIALSRWKLFMLYLIPSVLYCLSNNLIFINLRHFEPTTYNVLQQLKIVLTGILFQTILKKKLSLRQWFAIVLLTVGCVIKQLGASKKSLAGFHDIINIRGALLFVQIGCTALSGVFNECLIKKEEYDLHIMIHNVFIYADSVLCNLIVLVFRGKAHDLTNPHELSNIFAQPLVLAIIVNGAIGGIMVSLFLKYFDSIVRVFTSSIEMALMAGVCFFTFGTPVDAWTVVAIVVVSIATYVFAKETNDAGSKSDPDSTAENIPNKEDDIQIVTRL